MSRRPTRRGGVATLVAVVCFEGGLVWGLLRLGSVDRWQVDWSNWSTWLRTAPPEDAVVAMVRWMTLVVAAWLLFSSLLYCGACLTRVPKLIRGTRWLTLPVLRSVVERALVVTVATSTVVGARTAAWAQPPAHAVALGQRAVAAAVVSRPAVVGRHSAATPDAPDRIAPLTVAAAGEWEVKPGDHLWHIAAARICEATARDEGSLTPEEIAPYWRDLVEANRATLRSGHPSLIFPGEQVTLPALMSPRHLPTATSATQGATETPLAEPPAPGPGSATPTVDSMTVPSSVIPSSTTTSTTTTSTTPPASTTTVMPVTTTPAPPETSVAVGPSPRPTAVKQKASRSTRPTPQIPAAVVAAAAVGVPTLLAGTVLLRLDRLRRARQRRRRTGAEVERPDASLEPVERRVRAIADTEAAEWVDLSLRYLWRALAESGGPVPEITCVRAGQMGIEVLVDPPCPIAPEGYVVADEGHAWRLDPDISRAELKERAKGHSPLVPALLTVGDTPEGAVLLDLERAGTLSIEGDAERVAGFLAGAALEMATAPWATDTPVCLLGGDGRLGSLDLVEVIGDPDRFVARIETQLSGDNHSTVAARVAGGGLEGWAPVVVVAAPGGADPDVVRHLAGLAPSSGAGLVVVAPGPVPGAGWRLVIAADGNAVLEPLGMELTARVDRETVSTLTALVTGASAGEPQGPDHPRSDGVPDDMALRAPVVAGDLFVGVLGPVVVEGPTLEGDIRPKLVEVVAYLAAHQDERVDGERLRSALWPLRDDDPFAGDVLDATFRSTVSRARAALGTHPSGSYHLPRPENGAYQLGPGVMCDWTRFKTLVRQAHAGSSGDEAGLLSEALGLVRGPPFAGHPRGQYGWAWSELIVSEMEVAIADAAEELAERAVASGDHDTAMWAARQGLVVAPYRESLYRCRMEAAAGTGDLDGIRRVYDEARRAAEELGALGEPEPETVELYERLLDTASARLPAGAVHS